jgi:hypothetical protein
MLALLRRRDVVRASPFCSPASEPPLTLPFGKFKGELVDLLLARPEYAMAIVREVGHADLWRMSRQSRAAVSIVYRPSTSPFKR